MLSHTAGSAMAEPPDSHSPSPASPGPNHNGKRWEKPPSHLCIHHQSQGCWYRQPWGGSSTKSPTWAWLDLQPLGILQHFPVPGQFTLSQVICCNIVAGSYSRFAEVCDVLGVLGLPQSTAGRRYEISIYIPQPGQQSDNLTAKVQGERSCLERQAGQERFPESLGNGDPTQSTQPLFPGELPQLTHPALHVALRALLRTRKLKKQKKRR